MHSTLATTLLLLALLAACSSGPAATPARSIHPVPDSWMDVPQAAAIAGLKLDAAGNVTHTGEPPPRPVADGAIHVAVDDGQSRIANGLEVIAGPFDAIDSLDHSEERGEVAFSASRDGDFDIGLVASDGSAMNWMPDDPADEVSVQWAPRGNKISYVIRASGGDVVRTLHIPTAFQFAIPFENATIHELVWDPEGATYAVAYSTPDTSDRVEVLAYDGTPRRTVIAPAERLDVEVEPFGRDAIVLRPRQLSYDEKLPVVVWQEPDFGWSDARAALMRAARVALVVTKAPPTRELWERVAATAWIDASRAYRVGEEGEAPEHAVVIAADPALDPATYARHGGRVTAAPAVVQSLAARYIAGDLERTSAPDGSRR